MIDWILAERLAALVAGSGDAPAPRGDLATLATDAETRVVRYTGLTPSRPLPAPEGIGRRDWVRANVAAMRRLLDPVLERAAANLSTPSRTLKPAVSLAMSAVVTTEVGVVLGYLAQRVLGQYELVLLEEADGPGADAHPPRLLFVLPNLGGAVRALEVPEDEFVRWVTLHEVTHAVQFAGVPWLQGHVAGLVSELLRSAEVRIDAPPRVRMPSRAELRRMAAAARRGDVVGIFVRPAERETLDRVQAVMAVIEGHAEHVMDAVAPELLPSLPRLRAALDRRRGSQRGLARLLGRLLGLELKLRQYEQGKFFCDAIVRTAGTEALVRLFESPESLPTLAELDSPRSWVARVGLAPALPAATPTRGA